MLTSKLCSKRKPPLSGAFDAVRTATERTRQVSEGLRAYLIWHVVLRNVTGIVVITSLLFFLLCQGRGLTVLEAFNSIKLRTGSLVLGHKWLVVHFWRHAVSPHNQSSWA